LQYNHCMKSLSSAAISILMPWQHIARPGLLFRTSARLASASRAKSTAVEVSAMVEVNEHTSWNNKMQSYIAICGWFREWRPIWRENIAKIVYPDKNTYLPRNTQIIIPSKAHFLMAMASSHPSSAFDRMRALFRAATSVIIVRMVHNLFAKSFCLLRSSRQNILTKRIIISEM
jgi:hypothetical protein